MTRRRQRRTAARIYPKGRDRRGRPFYYGDFRAFRAQGGRLEALKVSGERHATTSVETAEELFAARLRELKRLQAAGGRVPVPEISKGPICLVDAFRRHLDTRAASGNIAMGTLVNDEKAAQNLYRILGDIPLRDIDAQVLATYIKERRAAGHRQTGRPLSDCTLRNEMHSLSGLLGRAVFEKTIASHPMHGWKDLPDAPSSRRRCLSREEARSLLQGAEAEDARIAARQVPCGSDSLSSSRGCGGTPIPFARNAHTQAAALVATLLYTGGRSLEVSGLAVEDVDFAAGVIRIRPNRFRPLKRSWAKRVVPMPAALARRLTAHIASRRLGAGDALFPNVDGRALTTVNGLLRRCARLGNVSVARLSAHCLRHTFTTVMLRTTIRTVDGIHVLHTPFEVAKLLGHKRSDLVETVYAHWHPSLPIEARLDFEPCATRSANKKEQTRRRAHTPARTGATKARSTRARRAA